MIQGEYTRKEVVVEEKEDKPPTLEQERRGQRAHTEPARAE